MAQNDPNQVPTHSPSTPVITYQFNGTPYHHGHAEQKAVDAEPAIAELRAWLYHQWLDFPIFAADWFLYKFIQPCSLGMFISYLMQIPGVQDLVWLKALIAIAVVMLALFVSWLINTYKRLEKPILTMVGFFIFGYLIAITPIGTAITFVTGYLIYLVVTND